MNIKHPWEAEKDLYYWVDAKTKLPCLILRHEHFKHLNGYVQVPWYSRLFGKKEKAEYFSDVHGGVTFIGHLFLNAPDNKKLKFVSKNSWWVGFDTGHSCDFQPGFYSGDSDCLITAVQGMGNYKTVAYVKNECKKLAQQIYII